ncbi:hypothetical protein AB0C27_53990 [Nonomuraea sp. NPDC048882]|uniref:hypothetical protein n=1 Tax=Nonomuraea sp. NPDC048882 TaxID=3154347 RepID=UPI0033CC8207
MSNVDPPAGRPRSRRARRDRQSGGLTPPRRRRKDKVVYEERNLVETEGAPSGRADPRLPGSAEPAEGEGQGVYEERNLVEKEGAPTPRADPDGLTRHKSMVKVGRWGSMSVDSSAPIRSLTETAVATLMVTVAATLPAGLVTVIGISTAAPYWTTFAAVAVIFTAVFGMAIYLAPSRQTGQDHQGRP